MKVELNECITYLDNIIQSSSFVDKCLYSSYLYLKDYKKLLNKNKQEFTKQEVNNFFDKIWNEYIPNYKKGRNHVKFSQRKKLYKIGFDVLKNCIDLYKAEKINEINSNSKYVLIGSTFFNGRYEDYLSKSKIQPLEYIEIEREI